MSSFSIFTLSCCQHSIFAYTWYNKTSVCTLKQMNFIFQKKIFPAKNLTSITDHFCIQHDNLSKILFVWCFDKILPGWQAPVLLTKWEAWHPHVKLVPSHSALASAHWLGGCAVHAFVNATSEIKLKYFE